MEFAVVSIDRQKVLKYELQFISSLSISVSSHDVGSLEVKFTSVPV